MRRDPITQATFTRHAAVLAAGLSLTVLVGCAGAPTAPAATADSAAAADRADRSDRQTGSNLPRRSGQTSQVIVADPAAVQSGGRATTRATGTGP